MPLTQADEGLRQELLAAQASVQRQLELLRSPARGADYSHSTVAMMSATLNEIETALADLATDEP